MNTAQSIVLLVLIVSHVLWCYVIGRNAEKKGRSGWTWFWIPFLLGFVTFFGLIFLYGEGIVPIWVPYLPWSNVLFSIIVTFSSETDYHRRKRIEEEEQIRRKVWEDGGSKESLIDKYREP